MKILISWANFLWLTEWKHELYVYTSNNNSVVVCLEQVHMLPEKNRGITTVFFDFWNITSFQWWNLYNLLLILFICRFGFNGRSALLMYLVTVSFYSHSLASQATATELIIAKCCNRTAIMFFEVCVTPDSQTDEFFNKLSFITCISFLNCLETKFTRAALFHTHAHVLSGLRDHTDVHQAKVKSHCTYR